MSDSADAPRAFLVSYTPLVATPHGRNAAAQFRLPPFIDGSIRREPDLEIDWPSISCLCRAGKFAPRLRVGDWVCYMTKKQGNMRRLAAVLCVAHVFDSHAQAANWYNNHSLKLPSNCMV